MAVQVDSSVTDIDAMKGEFPRIGWLLRLLSLMPVLRPHRTLLLYFPFASTCSRLYIDRGAAYPTCKVSGTSQDRGTS